MDLKLKSIKLNFFMNALLTMSSFVFPIISFPYVSRVLLPVGTGRVSMATSFIAYFTLFSQLGIPTYGVRACAKVRDNREELTRTVHELLFINIILSVLVYFVLFTVILCIPKLQQEKSLYVIISSQIILSAIGMEWMYKGLEQYTYITMRSLIFKIIALLLMFALIKEQKDYVVYGGLTIFAASASNVMNLVNAHRYISLRPIGGYHPLRHLNAVAVFFAMACATTIYTNLDTVMLGFIRTYDDVGYYNAAVKVKTVLVSVITSLGVVLLPRASYYLEHEFREEFFRISKKAYNFVLLISIPMAVYFLLFAKQGILLLSGPAYLNAVVPMKIIMPTLVFIGITNIWGIQMLVPLGREKIVLYSEIAGAVVDLILNIILIPHFAAAGAAFGTLCAEVVVMIVQFGTIKNIVTGDFFRVKWSEIFVAIGVAIIASFWIPWVFSGSFIVLAVSAFLFFGCYGLILLLERDPLVLEIVDMGVRALKKIKRSGGK